jgi:hypothetical protein
MADEASGLTFVLDQNFSQKTLDILGAARMKPEGRITSLTELGYAGDALDEDWMVALGKTGSHAVVTRDGEILRASVRIEAWQQSGLTLMLLDGRWGQLPVNELMRALIYWWPLIVDQAEAGKPGTAWTVPRTVPSPGRGIRLVTPRSPTPRNQRAEIVEISKAVPQRKRATK